MRDQWAVSAARNAFRAFYPTSSQDEYGLGHVPAADSGPLPQPRNHGELGDPTFNHEGYNPSCGDELEFDVELTEDGETIERVAFRGEGCAISQASASMLSQELPG